MTALDDLTLRVTALDGIGSQVPSASSVPTIFAQLNSLNTTIQQLTLTLQAQLNTIAVTITTLQGVVNQVLGVNQLNVVRNTQTAKQIHTVTSGEIAGTNIIVPLVWSTAFTDLLYTATASVVVTSGNVNSYKVNGITKTLTGATVSINVSAGVNLDTIEVDATAVHN